MEEEFETEPNNIISELKDELDKQLREYDKILKKNKIDPTDE